jgi:hypothetical protein
MVVDTQATVTMHRKVANGCPAIDNLVENTRSQLPRMAEDDIRIRPPTPKNGTGNHPVKVAIRDNPPNIQFEDALCHVIGQMATPMVVSEL